MVSNMWKTLTKYLLISFVVMLALLAVHFAWLGAKAEPQGFTPFSSLPLADGTNEGRLAPGEQHWYKLVHNDYDADFRSNMDLTLMFTPDNGQRVRNVGFQLFEEEQLANWYEGDTSKMVNFGAGSQVSRDDNPNTGEYLWSGWIVDGESYYIQVFNNTDAEVDYWLFTDDVARTELGPPARVEAEPAIAVPAGIDPGTPASLKPGLNTGSLKAGQEIWYAFTHVDFDSERSEPMDLTMFFTPDDGNRAHNVTFELFPALQLHLWQRGQRNLMRNFGAGSLVSRDGDPATGERVWNGWIQDGDTYFLLIQNGSDVDIDYWLYQENVINPILGPVPEPVAAPTYPSGASPQTAEPLVIGLNKGGLDPGQEAWYYFSLTDFDDQVFEPMALTMITTPDDGNRQYYMTFDIYEAGEVHRWSPGDSSRLRNLGAGGVIFRDNNPVTGERLWSGWVIDNDLYYVQVRNGADVHMDYWLFTGDVVAPELGEKPVLAAETAAAPGSSPWAPQPLAVGVEQDSLDPGQERWYTFSRADVGDGMLQETMFTMIFTPDDGNRVYNVEFQLFEKSQLDLWAQGGGRQMQNFGAGSVVFRDGDPNTGELLWRGVVLRGDQYFLQVRNGADVPIDYWIFPEDVIHADLN